MAVGRGVTAPGLPAGPADTQMHPGAPDLQAFLAPVGRFGPVHLDLAEVCAVRHPDPFSVAFDQGSAGSGRHPSPLTWPKLSSPCALGLAGSSIGRRRPPILPGGRG